MNRRSWLILSVLSLGTLLVTLDASMILVAIPSISGGLHATVDQVVWMLTGYTLVFAVLLIPCGRLGDMIERRNLFAGGALLLGAASALCGLAQTPEQLIAFRVLQGVGAGVATPQALTIAYSVFPPERRGTAFGFGSAAAGLGTVAGPLLGGLVTFTFGWRWVFYINVPIAAALVVGTFMVVPRVPTRRRRRFDWIGVLLLGGSLLAVVFALAEGERYRWGAVLGAITIPGILVAGLALAAVFVIWERGRPEPLVPLPLFKDANLSIAVWLNFSMYVALAFPLAYQAYLQAGLGLSTLVAGLALIPINATYAVTSPLGGWLTDRFGGKYVVMAGIALFALGLAGLAVVATGEPTPVAFVLPLAVGGLGMAAFFSSVTVLAIRRVPPEMAGAASGVINAGRWVGGVVGLAVVGAIVQVALTDTLGAGAAANATSVPARPVSALAQRALADGYVFALRWVLVVMVVLLVIGVLLSLGFATDRSPEPAPAVTPSPSPANRPRPSA
jgi:EmrB/QacA subfamily drug resistance transporter